MMVVLIELYPFIALSVTLITFQGHSSIRQLRKIHSRFLFLFLFFMVNSYPIEFKFGIIRYRHRLLYACNAFIDFFLQCSGEIPDAFSVSKITATFAFDF